MPLQLNSEAKKLLVDSYVALRKGDTTPGSRVAYRMTVRQLEALIRLSEAIARSHLENQVLFFLLTCVLQIVAHIHITLNREFKPQVQPRHVRLAVRLLKTSIIRQANPIHVNIALRKCIYIYLHISTA